MKTRLSKALLTALLVACVTATPAVAIETITINATDVTITESQTTVDNLSIKNGGSFSISGGAEYDLTAAQTLQLQSGGKVTVTEGTLKGGSNNFWLYAGEVNVDGSNSTVEVCTGQAYQNYRALLGLSDAPADVNVTNGGTFVSSASQFVTNFYSNTTVNISVDGEGSTFTQTATTQKAQYYPIGSSGEWVWHDQSYKTDGTVHRYGGYYDKDSTLGGVKYDTQGPTITYLCDSGTDKSGCKYDARDNCTTNISATNGGKIVFDSVLTYIGSFLDKQEGYTNKSANFLVDEKSSISFNTMEIYADTNIDNQGGEFIVNGTLTLHDGATLTFYVSTPDATVITADQIVVEDGGVLEFSSSPREDAIVMLFGDAHTDALLNTTVNADLYLSDNSVLKVTGTTLNLGGNDLVLGDNVSFILSDDVYSEPLFSGVSSIVDKEGNAVTSLTINGGNNEIIIDAAGNVTITTSVPEPATATLSLLALTCLMARRRRSAH